MQLLGSQKTATTNARGQFVLGPLFVDCATLNYLQVDKSGFYRNRVDYACARQEASSDYYGFSAASVDSTATEAAVQLTGTAGIVIGHVGYRDSVKMQLWGPEEMNPDSAGRGKDFYFDLDGVLNPSRNRTAKSGNFAILDAPEGISYMQAFSADNRTLSFWPVYISASTVNVYVQ
ncbi:MAG: hypothetical protein HY074_08995 [Deltaproteobacteria bacterium]|nr:hypothetical protein [Deltaproteobacteria bacterium]